MPLHRIALLVTLGATVAVLATVHSSSRDEGDLSPALGNGAGAESPGTTKPKVEPVSPKPAPKDERTLRGCLRFVGGRDPGGPIRIEVHDARRRVARIEVSGKDSFAIPDLGGGPLRVVLDCPNAAAPVERAIGLERDLEFRLRLLYPLELVLNTSNGAALPPEIELALRPASAEGSPDAAPPEERRHLPVREGRARWPLPNLAPGQEYVATISGEGFRSQPLRFEGCEEAKPLAVTLSPATALSGELIWAGDELPVPDASLLLRDSDGKVLARTASGEDGRFDFEGEGLEEGRLEIVHPFALPLPLHALEDGIPARIVLKPAGSLELVPLPEGPSLITRRLELEFLLADGQTLHRGDGGELPALLLERLPPGPLTLRLRDRQANWQHEMALRVEAGVRLRVGIPGGVGSCRIAGTLKRRSGAQLPVEILLQDSSGHTTVARVPADASTFRYDRLVKGSWRIATRVRIDGREFTSPWRDLTLAPGTTPVTLALQLTGR